MAELRVFTFSPAWGLPSAGPFALKLLAWLGANGIAHEQVIENRPAKGPLGKSPWIEIAGRRIGDSEAIVAELAARHGLARPAPGDGPEAAAAHAFRTAFEEHFHQVLEWELFLHPAGAAGMRALLRAELPAFAVALAFPLMRRGFARQLHARGIARLAPERIAEAGRRDLDALEAHLAGRAFLNGTAPDLDDFAVWGQVAPLLAWPMPTAVAGHARTLARVSDWAGRVRRRAFGDAPGLAA